MLNNRALLFIVLCIGLFETAFALREFDVYRLVSYEQNGKQFGSKISSFTLVGTHFSGDLLRKLAIIHQKDFTEENVNNLLNKKPSGLLIIVPKEQIGNTGAPFWNLVNENLISRSTQIPVYFCEESELVSQFYEKSRSTIAGDKPTRQITLDVDATMNVIVNSGEPKLLKSVAVEDFFGVLDENTPTTRISATTSPVILLVASYDSFTYAPETKLGFNQFSSGPVALLNIARQLSEFFETNKDISYNVLFFLTSSRSFNFEGLETWLNKAENSRIVNRIDYAIYLDSIGGGNNLHLDVYNANQESSRVVFDALRALEDVAKTYAVRTQLIQTNSKIFAGKFPVVRITDSETPLSTTPTEWSGSSAFVQEAFNRNLVVLEEFFTNTVYGIQKNFQLIDTNGLNQEFLSASLRLFQSKSTFPSQITKESAFTQELYRAFSEVVKHPYRNSFSYSTPQFYTPSKTKAKLTRINSAFFDFYLFLGNVAWLTLLYFVLHTKSKSDQGAKLKREDSTRRAKSPRKVD